MLRTMTLLLLPATIHGVHAMEEADIEADIAAGAGAAKCLLRIFR